MRNDFLQLAFYAIALVIGGACEEFLPKASGVGVPVLLALTVGVAARKPIPTMLLFAVTAGAFEDALSSLPTLMSPCLFLAVAALVRKTRLPKLVLVFAYPLYEVWLTVVVPGMASSFGMRVLTAFVMAVPTALVCPVLAWLERKAALDAE